MSSPDLFLHSITLMMMIAMRVMPATAAITIHNVLFLSFPCPAKAALSGEEGDFNSVNQPHNCLWFLNVCVDVCTPHLPHYTKDYSYTFFLSALSKNILSFISTLRSSR